MWWAVASGAPRRGAIFGLPELPIPTHCCQGSAGGVSRTPRGGIVWKGVSGGIGSQAAELEGWEGSEV